MNPAFIAKAGPVFLKAVGLTSVLALAGILISLLAGFLAAMLDYHKVPILKSLSRAYIELARNTPLMIQLFFLYFGLPRIGVRLDGVTCAILGLSFLGGGYMAEAFRGGLEAVGKSQIESGLCLGLGRAGLIRFVVLPQALAVALPALSANVIFLIKETSVFSVVALADITYVANDLMIDGHSNEINLLMVLSYLVLVLPVSVLLGRLERRLRHAGFSG